MTSRLTLCVLTLLALTKAAPAAVIESSSLRIQVAPSGRYSILDKHSHTEWASNPFKERLGEVALRIDGTTRNFDLDVFSVSQDARTLRLDYHVPGGSAGIAIEMGIGSDDRSVGLRYRPTGDAQVESIRLLDEAMWTTDAESGYAVLPIKVGAMVRADAGKDGPIALYEDLEMWMLGLVKSGSALLVTWDVPYVKVLLNRTHPPSARPGPRVLCTSLLLRKQATSFTLHFLGKGDYLAIARAYRQVARNRGLLVTWDEKLKGNPETAKLFGAACFRIPRLMERIIDDQGVDHPTMKVSFAEAIQQAEHLKYDLAIDKALMIMPGWIRRGYDNQHPDILPAAPECGGNEEFARASRRIRELGYLFCPHDNYQDIYRDAPSWSEDLVRKSPDGKLVGGDRWEGGQAYLACSAKSLELARRNLPEVKRLFNPNAYFIDTTFCMDLDECYDPRHPLTKVTDLKYRAEMCDLARSLFNVLGSEDGKEWAIPHSDFFEGLSCCMGYKAKPGVLPLFEMVYHDCIVVYGKWGYDVDQAAPYLLHQLRQGMPLNYHFEPPRLYWQQPEAGQKPAEIRDGWDQPPSCFCRSDNGWAEGRCRMDAFLKNTWEITSPLHEMTARETISGHQFLKTEMTAQRITFGGNVDVVINETGEALRCPSRYGGEITLPCFGFLVESPTYIAFHALNWNGLAYRSPALFTLRSLDAKPIATSQEVRVYHGFGDDRLRLGNRIVEVRHEATIRPTTAVKE